MQSQIDSRTAAGQRFEFLDGLRGIAAVSVVLFHFNNLFKEYSVTLFPSPVDSLLGQGHLGVEIFFVLSGFVIAYSLRNQEMTLPFVCQFFMKRSIRLDPPFWSVIAVLIFLSVTAGFFKAEPAPLPTIREVTINLFYLSEFLGVPRILPVSWTLALEIQFYLFLIFVLKFIRFLNRKFPDRSEIAFPGLCVILFLMIFSLLQASPYAPMPNIPGLFIPHWYSFFIGSLLCWKMSDLIDESFFRIHLALLGGFALIGNAGAFATLLISAFIYMTIRLDKLHVFLRSPLFQYLGKISYSLYLTHWLIGVKLIDIAFRIPGLHPENKLTGSLVFGTAFCLSILAADGFYRLIELPSLKFSRNFKFRKPKEA